MGFKGGLALCGFWISLAALFNLGILYWMGPKPALEFLTGYLIEQSLSIDNLFVFMIVFSYFAVPKQFQHRVLFYGILGAIVFRGIFVLIGAELIEHFHWAIYIFGLILIVSGIKLLRQNEEKLSPERNPVVRLFRKLIPLTTEYHGQHFMVRQKGKLMATPLALVLVSLEFTDIVFAVDSVPAIFAITRDPFIVFTSIIFAILGLRSMYFVLSNSLSKLEYLNYGLALVLIFVGCKMLLSETLEIPVGISLIIIVVLILSSVVVSLAMKKKRRSSEK